MTASDLRPFLLATPAPTRPLASVLPSAAAPPAFSPWSPAPVAEASPVPSADELAAIHAEARERGRADGLAETAALRARLSALLDQLDAARVAIVPPAAEIIAEVATCVVETWIGNLPASLVFAPIVRSWLAHAADQPTTARVHPLDAAALAEAVGEAPLAITTDPSLARGALALTSATRELVHDWSAHLGDLRTAIVTAMTGVDE